ncbi:MAG: hypothetical protein IPJ56_05135 [Gemmatimonadetes bacterium]|nr:hypothetical protein [Gemmatimonadota bacterium]
MRYSRLRDEIEAGERAREARRRPVSRYWSEDDIATLVRLAESRASTRQIAAELRRSSLAVRLKASRIGLPLTAHEVRRSAKRHARQRGETVPPQGRALRTPPRIKVTVDFDLSSLSRAERLQLAARLYAMHMEEGGATPQAAEAAAAEFINRPRPLRLHEPYDASAATSRQNTAANAKRAANRAALGWKRTELPPDHELRMVAEARHLVRQLDRRLREQEGTRRRASLDALDKLAGFHADAGDLVDRFDRVDRNDRED